MNDYDMEIEQKDQEEKIDEQSGDIVVASKLEEIQNDQSLKASDHNLVAGRGIRMKITNSKSTKTALTFLSFALTATSLSTIAPGVAAEPSLRMPSAAPVRRAVRPADAIPDQLLVMAGGNADMGEFNDALQSVKGTVINTIGEGMQKVYAVQTERGQAAEAQKKLLKNENVAMVQRNWQLQLASVAPKPTVNDPFFPSEWHIAGVNATAACWKLGNGHGVTHRLKNSWLILDSKQVPALVLLITPNTTALDYQMPKLQ